LPSSVCTQSDTRLSTMISCCRFSEDKDLRAAVSNPSTRAASPPPASTASPFADRLVNSGRVDDEEEVEKPAYCPICHVKFAIAATTSQVNAHVDRCLVPDKATDAFLWAESFDLINAPYYFGLVSREDAEGILNRCPWTRFWFASRRQTAAASPCPPFRPSLPAPSLMPWSSLDHSTAASPSKVPPSCTSQFPTWSQKASRSAASGQPPRPRLINNQFVREFQSNFYLRVWLR